MSNAIPRIPSYRHHKPSGLAVVTVGGRDIYLGKWNTAESRREYNRVVAEWTAHGGMAPTQQATDLTVVELLAAFMRHARRYYRGPDGKSTHEVETYAGLVRRLKTLYGPTRVPDFGPLALKAVRQCMIDDGLARRSINQHVGRVRHIFKWGVENELVPPNVLHGLQAVAGLRRGRSDAKETAPVRPVPDAFVDAVLPFVSRQVAAMVELQRVTGMRSGEVTAMRGCDLNMSGSVWIYAPEQHKTAWHGHERHVYLGPKAQAIIRPFLTPKLEAYLFSPADAEAERNNRRFGVVSRERKTKVYPSELRGRDRRREARVRQRRKRGLRDRYTPALTGRPWRTASNGQIARLAEAKANGMDATTLALVPHWHPHQLRHNAATTLRREHGIEVARIILGHRSAAITEVYAEVDYARAVDIMAQIG